MQRSTFVSVLATLAVFAGCGKWSDKLACGSDSCDWTKDEWSRIQTLAFVCTPEQAEARATDPTLPCGSPIPADRSNKYLPISDWDTGALKPDAFNDPVVQLGRRFYFDTSLSGSATWKDALGRTSPSARAALGSQIKLSCASCHDPARFGSDFTSVPRTVSIGAGWYDVNGQSTLNAGRYPLLYWNGRSDALWAQSAQVMESGVSMNGHRMKTFWIVVNHYRDAYAAIFPDAPAVATDDPANPPPTIAELAASLQAPAEATAPKQEYTDQYEKLTKVQQRVVTWVHVNVSKAIGAYEWLLTSDHSKFDTFVNEGPESTAIPPAAKRGLKLFIGKASCLDCHSTPMLSDGKFHNIGIPQVGTAVPTVAECVGPDATPTCNCISGTTCLPWGAYAGLKRLATQEFSRHSIYSDDAEARANPLDPNAIMDEALKGAWRTPSLRDVAMTGPYMHDGNFDTLAEVVWHYDQGSGIGAGAGTVGHSELTALNMTTRERDDLVAFLATLTGGPLHPALGAPPTSDGGVTPAVEAGTSPDGGATDAVIAPADGGDGGDAIPGGEAP